LNYVHDLVRQMGTRDLRLDRKSLKGKRAYKLYLYLKKTKNPSPAGEAAVLECMEGGSVHRKTLRHLECVLVNNLTALQPGEMTSGKLADTRKYVWKLIAIGRRLINRPDSVVIVPFMKEAFHHAEKAGLVSACKTSSELLAILLGHLFFDEKEYLFYRKRADYYREINLVLQRATLCYRETTYRYNAGENTASVIAIAEGGLNRLQNSPLSADHPSLILIAFQLKNKIAEIKNSPEEIVCNAEKALEYIEGISNIYAEDRIAYLLYMSYAHLTNNDYDNGNLIINNILKRIHPKEHNYGKLRETLVLLSLRTKHYHEAENAYDAFSRWADNNDPKKQFEKSIKLFQSYLKLLKLVKVTKFDKSKDKINITGTKMQMDNLLRLNDSDTIIHYLIIGLIEKLAKGQHRSARKRWRELPLPRSAKNIRYKCFYNLLAIVFKQDFHRMAVERHAIKYLNKLRSIPLINNSGLSLDEVIPFEQMWEIVILQLDNKRIKLR